MEKLDVKLIAFDLDDTLLTDQRTIDDETVACLQECARKGIYIVLCSGRAEEGILPFVRRLEIAGLEAGRYIIAINGCSIFDMHKRLPVFTRKVSPEILLRVDELAEAAGFRTEVYTPDTIYYREATKYTRLDVDMCGLKGVEVKDYRNFLKTGFTKMLVPGDPEALLLLQARLKAELGEKAVIFTSKPFFLEILPPDCGKGEAIEWLSEELGFGLEKTMAFGDSMNDESMLRKCKYGVCMENGLPEMKAVSDFVTEKDNNNCGIADFIRKHVL